MLAFIILGLYACGLKNPLPDSTLPPPNVTIVHSTSTATLPPTETFTPTITPIPFLMYPYSINGLRERTFTGGEIIKESLLGLTDEYTSILISYPSDDLTISGVLNIPTGDGPFPVIIMNHGYYPRGEYYPGAGSQQAAEYLTLHGYITISSDYRTWGRSDFGESFFHTGLVADVMNLIASLSSLPEADTSRIGIWGHSMGGGITTKILTLDAPVRAAVLYAPNSADDADLIARWGYGCIGDISAGETVQSCNSADVIPNTLPDEIMNAYIQTATTDELLHKIAPYYYLNLITVPVQIHIGSADGDYIGSTPPEWSYKLNQAMLDAGKDVEMFVYDGQRHSFSGNAWILFMDRVVQFFDEELK